MNEKIEEIVKEALKEVEKGAEMISIEIVVTRDFTKQLKTVSWKKEDVKES